MNVNIHVGVSRWHLHANDTNKRTEAHIKSPMEDDKEEMVYKRVRSTVSENGLG